MKAFVVQSKNNALTQIWIAMIFYEKVSFARCSEKTKKGWLAQRISRVLHVDLFERKTLIQLFKPEAFRYK